MEQCKYYWAKWVKYWNDPPIIVCVEQQDSPYFNCQVIGSEEAFEEDEFIFLREIEPYQER